MHSESPSEILAERIKDCPEADSVPANECEDWPVRVECIEDWPIGVECIEDWPVRVEYIEDWSVRVEYIEDWPVRVECTEDLGLECSDGMEEATDEGAIDFFDEVAPDARERSVIIALRGSSMDFGFSEDLSEAAVVECLLLLPEEGDLPPDEPVTTE